MSTVARYWREIPQRYRMEAGKCTGCGKVAFPPRRVCPECGKREFENVALPFEGKILTYTVVHTGPDAMKDISPYVLAVVELADGTRITSQIADCDPDEAKIDLPVRVEFRRIATEGEDAVLQYGYKCVPVR